MNGINQILKSTCALGVLAFLAQPALAMTCAEYSQLDEAAQQEAFETRGGRENLREAATGSDEGEKTTDANTDGELGDPDDDIGGRAAARAAATGSDEEIMVVLKEECEANPDMQFDDIFEDPETRG